MKGLIIINLKFNLQINIKKEHGMLMNPSGPGKPELRGIFTKGIVVILKRGAEVGLQKRCR